jgi:hypothetical protein
MPKRNGEASSEKPTTGRCRHFSGAWHECPGLDRCLLYFEGMADYLVPLEVSENGIAIRVVRSRVPGYATRTRLAIAVELPEPGVGLDKEARDEGLKLAFKWRERLAEAQGPRDFFANAGDLRMDLVRAYHTGERRVGWAASARDGMKAHEARRILEAVDRAGMDREEIRKQNAGLAPAIVEAVAAERSRGLPAGAAFEVLRLVQSEPVSGLPDWTLGEVSLAVSWFGRFLGKRSRRTVGMTDGEIAAELRAECPRWDRSPYTAACSSAPTRDDVIELRRSLEKGKRNASLVAAIKAEAEAILRAERADKG